MSGDRRRAEYRFVTKKEKKQFLSPPPKKAWIWLTREMLESPAYRALSRAGIQLLTCLMVEHCAQGGKENSRLAVSWNEFEAWGINRGMISQTIEEVTRLGFVRIVDKGRKGYGSVLGRRATFRLTFVGVVGSDEYGHPTDEWAAISEEDARAIVGSVRSKERSRKASRTLSQPEDIERGADDHTGLPSDTGTRH